MMSAALALTEHGNVIALGLFEDVWLELDLELDLDLDVDFCLELCLCLDLCWEAVME